MNDNILHIATEIKSDISKTADNARKNFMDFASTYSITPKLRHEAIILNFNYNKAPEEKRKAEIQEEMLGLVDKIVQDYKQNAHTKETEEAKQARELLENHWLSQKAHDEVVFSCNQLGKTYKRTGFSLQDVNLQLRLGEITGVVGLNGNGKTTLFNIIAGESKHDEGEIFYPYLLKEDSEKINWYKVKDRLAYVPQELPKWFGSLVRNIQFEAAMHGIKGQDNKREVDYIIQRMGLEEHLDKRWKELSGGYKLRFALAKALVWKPKLLVIDEPLANLDIKAQQIVLKDLRNLSKGLRYPMSIIISSQHLYEIESVSDKILFLENGSVTFYNTKEAIGKARNFNTFELGTPLSLSELRKKLSDIPIKEMFHNGMDVVLSTPLEIGYKELLHTLLKKDIEIIYFRNISQSIKQLFETRE